MKKVLCVASALFLLAGMASAGLVPLRIVASPVDYPVSPDDGPVFGAPLTPGVGDGYDANGNPYVEFPECSGSVTFNVWAEVDLDHSWNGLGLDIHATNGGFASMTLDIAPTAWAVVGLNGKFKLQTYTLARWNTGSDAYGDSSGDNITMVAVTEAGLGGAGDIGMGATSVYDAGSYAYVLEQRGTWFKIGTVTAECFACGETEIYLSYQPTNFQGGLKGESIMYYGWGAAGIVNLDENLGQLSDVPLITLNCVPEPASLILLALAGLVLRRR